MSRSVKKGPYVEERLMARIEGIASPVGAHSAPVSSYKFRFMRARDARPYILKSAYSGNPSPMRGRA